MVNSNIHEKHTPSAPQPPLSRGDLFNMDEADEQLNTNTNGKNLVIYYRKFRDYIRAHIWLQVVFAIFGFFAVIAAIIFFGMMALVLFGYITKVSS
ncbi:hypothetical protein A2331_05550 [Candidatus Falkowbacteria bacterium RIFOXYB2_FULL_34_18]|uniref:Uncharacterized protein n=1 Tax=Candidatus Falkowbacteria bacterium RIFOXYD2_FULL_34_120 TaxID=1798007 RepID=A0A1F5TR03_9BACT|nr:MAG: hypothetical protein A2331_05550 [Candidatus Falkowbacteria bacterium RIFOXYB2_FULL_34_18]OGF29827.1 MAG: hypothetical protein A2500_01480 [Candidatus Falkowbacteria bacterium RIFOXYC12_FULL_34_55]OGF37058.1 MAG: hypothetical protein A2466_05725 [Candidatus Falkowbacteria bacterium RIFOXYC2_FULL_34_220]OGF39250.1 MAG: hypothetical protein A2515_00935 [Candidatus Falkowbacteria bacterium RIFOXYD12_FULL_34_57]OGF41355.1 MAG: hypothetical protein A2531_07145 [Candidatus Falkowbacteria bact